MNHLTLYGYEDDNGELFVYRCPEESCGSSGPKGSFCGHDRPPSNPTWRGLERKPVRVPGVGEESALASLHGELATMLGPRKPREGVSANDHWIAAVGRLLAERDELREQVGEEPRYTLEQVRELLLGDGAKAVVVDFLGAWSFCPVSQASEKSRSCLEDAAKQLLEALDHFTQQPAGAGADLLAPEFSGGSGSDTPEASPDPGGTACPRCGSEVCAADRKARLELEELAEELDSDGNQQPQGGVKSQHGDGVTTRVSPAGHAEGDAQKQHTGVIPGAVGGSPALRASSVAEGDSVLCGGVALEELLGWVEDHRDGAKVIGSWLSGADALQEVADEIRGRLPKLEAPPEQWCGECGLKLSADMPSTVWTGHTHKPVFATVMNAAWTVFAVVEAGELDSRDHALELLRQAGITEQAVRMYGRSADASPQPESSGGGDEQVEYLAQELWRHRGSTVQWHRAHALVRCFIREEARRILARLTQQSSGGQEAERPWDEKDEAYVRILAEEDEPSGMPWESGPVDIAYCPTHGLHGCRSTCFVCDGPVQQIRMAPVNPGCPECLGSGRVSVSDPSETPGTPAPWKPCPKCYPGGQEGEVQEGADEDERRSEAEQERHEAAAEIHADWEREAEEDELLISSLEEEMGPE
jgi:hypothetical protein